MNRRVGAVAIVLMALAALAGLLSFVFFSQPVPKNSTAAQPTTTGDSPSDSGSTSSSSGAINPDPSEPLPAPNSLPLVAAAPRPDQPPKLKPQPPSRSPDWKLLDWSLKPLAAKPGIQLRASSYLASGKYPFVRVEEEVQVNPTGDVKTLLTKEMVGDQIIVKLPEGSPAEEIQSLAEKLGGQAAAKPFAPDTWLIALPRRLEAVPEALAGSTNSGTTIDYVEPNYLVRPMRTPNDPRINDFSQWHLYNNSQVNVDIKAPRAWDRRFSAAYGSTNKVIVAVIDSGVNYSHEDLNANMWKNPGEIAGDGIDNDGNGLTDDVFGADYRDGDGDPMDPNDSSHGTHCSGLIGAVGNNGIGVTGVAWTGVQIMALRFINGTGSLADEVKCIDYAISKGAKVINASFGFPDNNGGSSTESSAIQRASTAGIMFVAAAGNNGTSNDTSPFYPASYNRSNIIAVGATDRSDAKASFSNYGATSVDLMAPGVEMWSTTTSGTSTNSYSQGQGTSFAAPVVSGAVALLVAESPNDSVSTRRAKIVSTNAVDVIPGLNGQCVTGGRLNISKLLPAADVNTLPQALIWHRPDHLEGLIPSRMRIPATIALSNDVTIYSGLRKFNNTNGVNTNGLVNQTGGWLFYRTSSTVTWASNALAWHTNNGDYQFWKGTISNVPAQTYQYYLQLDFDSGARTTYSYYTNNADGFATTTNQITAQSSPYTFTVPKATASVIISSTNQTYNGSARPVSVTTSPSGLSNTVTYNGGSSVPINAGTYTVVATVNDPNYEGSASVTLNVAKAPSTILTLPAAGTITFGQILANCSLTGGTSTPAGSFTFSLPSTSPSAGISSHGVTFTPTDTTNYLTATTTVNVTVNKAPTTVSVAPIASPIRLGQNLGNSMLSGGMASVPGGFTFSSPGTSPGLGASYHAVIFTPTDTANYLSAVTSALVTVGGVENPTGDTDADGIPNLLEHAVAELSTGTGFSGQITTQSIETNGQPNTILTLTAVVRTNDTNLLIYPQATYDLSDSTNWISSGFTTNTSNQTNVPAGFQRRLYEFNAGTNPRAFLKLIVEQK